MHRALRCMGSDSSEPHVSAKGSAMNESLRTASQESKLTARSEERAAKRLLSERASSSPRASLAFPALAVVRKLIEILGELYRWSAVGGIGKKINGSVRYSSRS